MCQSIVRKQLCPVGLWALAFWLRSDCVLIAFWDSHSKSVANYELIALHASFFSVSICVVLFLYTRISSLCLYEVTCICLSMHMYMSIVTFYHGPYVDLFRFFVCNQAPCLDEFPSCWSCVSSCVLSCVLGPSGRIEF